MMIVIILIIYVVAKLSNILVLATYNCSVLDSYFIKRIRYQILFQSFTSYFYSSIDWTQCRTNFVESVKNQQQGFTSAHLLVKGVNHFLVEHPTTRLSFRNAKTIIDV